jgi:hypothetical protein
VTISGGALVLTSANALADGSSLTIGASASLIFGESLVPAMSASPAPFATGANSPTLGVSPPNANLAEGTAVDAVLASDLPLPTAASEMPRTRKLLPSLAQSHATTRTKLPAPPTTNRFGWWAIADALARKPKASLADKSVAAVDTLMQMYGKE